jgi:hypothetical protein
MCIRIAWSLFVARACDKVYHFSIGMFSWIPRVALGQVTHGVSIVEVGEMSMVRDEVPLESHILPRWFLVFPSRLRHGPKCCFSLQSTFCGA